MLDWKRLYKLYVTEKQSFSAEKLDLSLQYIYVSNMICAHISYICATASYLMFAPFAHWSVGGYS